MPVEPARAYLVEHEAILATDIANQLRRVGFVVLGNTGDTDRALHDIPRLKPDVVLIDITIKGPASGIATAERLQRVHDAPVVFLASDGDPDAVRQAVSSSPFNYVLVPPSDRELQVVIQVALYRHSVESRLQASERWAATLLSSVADGVIATDRTGRITIVNDAARRLTGWFGNDALGRSIEEVFLISESDKSVPIQGWAEQALVGQNTQDLPHGPFLRCRDGTGIGISNTIAPIRNEGGSLVGMVIVFRDQSAAIKAERLAQVTRAAEFASDRQTHFLASAIHELKTPLNAIFGFSELLDQDKDHPLAASQRDRLAMVRQAGVQLLEMLDDLMELTQLNDGTRRLDYEVLDPAALVDASIALVELTARENEVRIVRRCAETGDNVRADRRALEKVLRNLLTNGIRSNRRGGTLEVDIHSTLEKVEIAVRDQGKGHTSEQLDRLFPPLDRASVSAEAVRGGGLGLVTAQRLAGAFGGSLTAVSNRGMGTCFTLSLSKVTERAETPKPAAIILYVEDEPLNVFLVTEALREATHLQLFSANDGEQGLAMARTLLPDLLLCDVNLPTLNGRDVVKALRLDSATAALRCVAVSADATPEHRKKALEAGFDDYWTKPLDVASLVQRLDDELAFVAAAKCAS